MGSLTPGATYIYERNGGEVYAREFGKSERTLVGYNLPQHRDPLDHRNYMSTPGESQLWHDVRMSAKENASLAKALDHALTIYYTIKDHGT